MESRTAAYLSQTFAESFKRESDLDEAVWRSMPFFAAAIGLAVAILPAIYRDALNLGFLGWGLATAGLILLSICSFGVAGWRFWQMIKLREYIYPPSDVELSAYRNELGAYYAASEMTDAEQDLAILNDLRELNIRLLSESTSQNRRSNAAKAIARSHTLLFMTIGFLMAFAAEGTILVREAFPARPGTAISKAVHDEDRTKVALAAQGARQEADAAAKSQGEGRRQLSEVARTAGNGRSAVTDRDRPAPAPAPSPPRERPEPPVVEHLKKSDPPSPPPQR